ncbi:MAG: DUF1801 domain-containing protein [Fibrobacterales bacterium]
MKKSKDPQVQAFLDDKKSSQELHFSILHALRKIVFDALPNVDERMMYGGIMFSVEDDLGNDEDFGGIFSSKKHVSFEFSQGYTLNDPKNILEGSGKYRRHLKIKALKDITDKDAAFYVKQI